jgi:hypothetical protein
MGFGCYTRRITKEAHSEGQMKKTIVFISIGLLLVAIWVIVKLMGAFPTFNP